MGNVIFVVIFVIFCAFLLGAGLISKRWVKESSDFVLAGREISTPINVVGVIAIGFAGTTVTLAPGFTIQYGLLGGLGWGVIYSVCGLLIFGLLYSNFVRRSGAQTLPEFLEMRYDGHTRSVVAITSVIGMCGIMANNVVSSVDNIAAFTGWNRLAITAIIFAVIIVFTFVSGLWATTITDLFQVLIGVVTFVLCQFPGGPTYLFAFANCWLVPPAILLGLGAIWPRFNGRGALWGAVCGMATMAVFTLLDLTKVFSINSYVYLATLGLVVTLVVAVIASLFGQPKYYGRPGWERVPTASNRKEVKLGELEKQILEMLRIGHCYMSDLTDALGVDSKTSGAAVENLDQGGYLVRAGMSGSKFYTFTITEKGLAALPALSGKEAEMAEEFLNPLYVQLLKVVKENPEQQAEFVQKNGIKSMRMSAICSHLTRRGYVVEGGLFKRKLRIAEKGAAALQKYA